MGNQLTSNAEALRLFFTDEVFLVKSPIQEAYPEPVIEEKKDTLPSLPQLVQVTSATVEIPKPAVSTAAKKTWDFTFLGKNQKRILILVNDSENPVSSKEGTELLRNLVKAINLTNNDFALVNYSKYVGAQFEDFHQVFNCELVLSFGVAHAELGLAVQPLHQMFNFGTTRLVFTSNLHGLHQDNPGKKALWATLQQIKS